mgnify:CR=1 FL=1
MAKSSLGGLSRKNPSSESNNALLLHNRILAKSSYPDAFEWLRLHLLDEKKTAELTKELQEGSPGYRGVAKYHVKANLFSNPTLAHAYMKDAIFRNKLFGAECIAPVWLNLFRASPDGQLPLQADSDSKKAMLYDIAKNQGSLSRILATVGNDFSYKEIKKGQPMPSLNGRGWIPCPADPATIFGRKDSDPKRNYEVTYSPTLGFGLITNQHVTECPVTAYGLLGSVEPNSARAPMHQNCTDRGDYSHRHRLWGTGYVLDGRYCYPGMDGYAGQFANAPILGSQDRQVNLRPVQVLTTYFP